PLSARVGDRPVRDRVVWKVLDRPRGEIAPDSAEDVVVIANLAYRFGGRAALDAGGINDLPQAGQEAVRLESAAVDRIEVQHLLVDLDLSVETDLRDRHKRLARISGPLR